MKFLTVKLTRNMLYNSIIFILIILILIAFVVKKFANVSVLSSQKVLPVYSVETDKKEIAITFDAAWGAEDTDELIDILNKYNAKAAFFCVGNWLDKNKEAAKKLSNNGHIIANHSNSHKHLDTLSQQAFLQDVKLCNDKIYEITNKQPVYYRGPYGEYNNQCVNDIRSIGMEYIQWDCDSIDWKKGISVEQIINNTMKNLGPGSILLFHNGLENTPTALNIILNDLQKQGYKFVSLDELILRDDYYIDNNGKQHKIIN